MTLTAAVEALSRVHWGEPTRYSHFEVRDLVIEVLRWDVSDNPEGVALYATVGASSWPVLGRHSSHRVEFFVGMLPAQDAIAGPLAALGLYSA